MRGSEAAALARVGRRWRWCQGAGGGPARLSWTSPKPVTPRHLETITGNNEGSGEPGCSGLEPCLCGTAKDPRPAGTPCPHLHRHCLPWPGHTGPQGQLSGKASPGAAVGAAGQAGCPGAWPTVRRSQPAQLPAQPAGLRADYCASLGLGFPKGSSGTTRLAGCSPRASVDLASLVPGRMLPLSPVEQERD